MTRRLLIITLALLCVVTVFAVAVQRRELLSLRDQKKVKFSRMTSSVEKPALAPVFKETSSSADVRELLQLRNQAGQLRRQRDELLPVRAEHQALLEQIAARGTNSALPANYIRKSEARLVGYKSPEETIQSFLYALRMRDITNLVEAFTPDAAARMRGQQAGTPGSLERLMNEGQTLVGLAVISQKQLQANNLMVEVQMLPGLPPFQFFFRSVNDQWKIEALP
jgi:hypothetical protein